MSLYSGQIALHISWIGLLAPKVLASFFQGADARLQAGRGRSASRTGQQFANTTLQTGKGRIINSMHHADYRNRSQKKFLLAPRMCRKIDWVLSLGFLSVGAEHIYF